MTKGKMLLTAAIALIAAVASAKTCHWTGLGGDGYWTNKLNWAEGEVPGRYVGGLPDSGEDCDEAFFGAVSEGAATTIDMDGHICISNLFITAEAPAYTFGTSASQQLGISYLNGTLTVCTNNAYDQVFVCKTMFGYHDPALDPTPYSSSSSNGSGKRTYIRNDGRGLLDFQGGWQGSYNHYPTFCGTGDIRTTDLGKSSIPKNRLQGTLYLASEKSRSGAYFKSGGLEPETEGTPLRRVIMPTAESRLCFDDWGNPSISILFGVDTVFGGEGIVTLYNSRPASYGNGTGVTVRVYSNRSLTISNRIEASTAFGLKYFRIYGAGKISFLNTLDGIHTLFRIDDSVELSVPKIGSIGCNLADTSIGADVETVSFNSSGTLNYIGSGETTDRGFHAEKATTVTVANSGSGPLALTGQVSADVDGAAFRLNAVSAPISFSGTVSGEHAIVLKTDGNDTITLENGCAFGSVSMAGGVLAFGDGVAAPSLPAVSCSSGRPVVRVASGKTLTVASVSVPGSGVLNFEIPDDATVVVSSLSIPARTYVNGSPAGITAEGVLYAKRTEWATATDGSWNDGTKWTLGVPEAGWSAAISAAGDSYTVTAASAPTSYPDVFVLSNSMDGSTATFKAEAAIGFTNKFVTIGAGGVLLAEAGLVVTNSSSEHGSFTVASGGTVRVTGGDFMAPRYLTATAREIDMKGGLVDMAGNASFYMPNPSLIGTGEFRFGGTARLIRRGTGGMMTICPDAAGETATLSFMAANNSHHFAVGTTTLGGMPGGTAKMNLAADGADNIMYINSERLNGVSGQAGGFWIGYGAGIGIIDISGGRLASGNPGFHVGCYYNSYSMPPVAILDDGAFSAPTGIVVVTGGDFRPSGWQTGCRYPDGLIVGDGAYSQANTPRARGFVYLRAGKISPNQNATYIGVGNGEGDLIQTGGTLEHSSYYTESNMTTAVPRYGKTPEDPDYSTYSYPFVVGLDGGIGRYIISNGTCTVNAHNCVFVGGADPDSLCWGATNPWTLNGYPVDATDAQGLFAVRGGTVTLGNSMLLGCDGVGELEIGTNGTLSIARDLVMSNSTASVLRIVMGETAAAPATTIGGKLILTDGAHLVLDLTEFRSGRIWTQLLSPNGGIEGDFAEGNVTIIPPTNPVRNIRNRLVLTSRDGQSGLWLYQPGGTSIILR